MQKTAIIGAILLIIMLTLYIIFGSGTGAQAIRNGITQSVEEDFKIKESLGQLFFAEGKADAKAVSGQIQIASLCMPVQCDYELNEAYGQKNVTFHCKRLSRIVAVCDGTVEACEENMLCLRHSDGKKSVYSGIGLLVKEGQSVSAGEIIGYAEGTLSYSLYESCVALNPLDYFQ